MEGGSGFWWSRVGWEWLLGPCGRRGLLGLCGRSGF